MRTRLRAAASALVLTMTAVLGVVTAGPASAVEGLGEIDGCSDPDLDEFYRSWSGRSMGAYTNTDWVPQGMAYDAKGDHLYVTMYHQNAAEVPRIVVYERSTSAFVKVVKLGGLPANAHVGGITIGRGNVYVVDSTGEGVRLSRIPIDRVRGARSFALVNPQITYTLKDGSGRPLTGEGSYVDFHAGNLFVGDFYKDVMRRFTTSDEGYVTTEAKQWIPTPSVVQGLQVTDSHFVFSRSWDRHHKSMVTTQTRDAARTRVSRNALPMMEGIVFAPASAGSSERRLYAVFESTSLKYKDSACVTNAIWSTPHALIFSDDARTPVPAPPPAPAPCDNDCWRAQLGTSSYAYTSNASTDPRLARIIFDPKFYLDSYVDVREWSQGKLATQGGTMHQHAQWHWLNYGVPQGRMGAATFDPAYYMTHHGDVAAAYGAGNYHGAIQHYVAHGRFEGRRASVFFDPGHYKARYGDIAAFPNADALDHFTVYGMSEGRQGSADFAPAWYLGTYPDLRNAYGSNNYRMGMSHWIAHGRHEGRLSHP